MTESDESPVPASARGGAGSGRKLAQADNVSTSAVATNLVIGRGGGLMLSMLRRLQARSVEFGCAAQFWNSPKWNCAEPGPGRRVLLKS